MQRLRSVYERGRGNKLLVHVVGLFKDQLFAVVPIALFIIAFVGIFLQRWQPSTGPALWGLLLVVIGLVLFLEGLRIFFVPLGEQIGYYLPRRHPMWVVLSVAGAFGILVTYAEPATAALVPLGSLVNGRSAPYVFVMLNRYRELTVVCIAIGVGIAAVVGTLRFLKKWSVKVVIPVCALPCLILSAWMMWGTQKKDLAINIGMAWDCGAITGGPVTVPILLSMGVGVTRHNGDDSVSGCGIITLASLFPICFVQLLSIFLAAGLDKEDIKRQVGLAELAIDKPPLQPFISGIRSIIPLGVVLMIVWFVLIKRKLPKNRLIPRDNEGSLPGFPDPAPELPSPEDAQSPSDTSIWPKWRAARVWLFAFVAAQIGIIVFNFGLSYGLVIQGANAGLILPATYTHLSSYRPSPRYSKSGGILLDALFGFCIGFLATLAEPAMQILGSKVKEITKGQITVSALKYTVAVGVGLGTTMGVCRVIFQIPVIYFILPSYALAMLMSVYGSEEFVALAWDSAGATTGEVSVPFLLSLGLNFAIASKSADGFGILTCASIGPVISVLGLYHIRVFLARRRAGLVERDKAAAQPALPPSQEIEPASSTADTAPSSAALPPFSVFTAAIDPNAGALRSSSSSLRNVEMQELHSPVARGSEEEARQALNEDQQKGSGTSSETETASSRPL